MDDDEIVRLRVGYMLGCGGGGGGIEYGYVVGGSGWFVGSDGEASSSFMRSCGDTTNRYTHPFAIRGPFICVYTPPTYA